MKRILTMLFTLIVISCLTNIANAQKKTQVADGVYLVSYGKTFVLEDEKNQRSISIEITQEGIDRRNNQKMYKIVCGKWTRRVVKDGLKIAIDAGLKSASASEGISVLVAVASKVALYVYDDVCDYFGEKR